MRKILEYIIKRVHFLFPEDLYLKILFYLKMGRKLDLGNPLTFNEKLQWLKLNDRNPEYTSLVDKILVKDRISKLAGEEYIVPTLGVWDKVQDIDFETLPDRFVLKSNHSGNNMGVVICGDKSKLDYDKARESLKKSLGLDIYKVYREWPYKGIRKRFFAEQYLGEDITDYKFFCFDGYADSVMLCIDRQAGDSKFYFFDRDWNLLKLNKRGKEAPEGFTLPKPENMDRMFNLASKLSEGLPFVRVDLYNVDGRIYFGEMTFFPASGFDANLLPETDIYFGDKIKL